MTHAIERSAVVVGRRGAHAAQVLSERGIVVVAEQASVAGALELVEDHEPSYLVVELISDASVEAFALVRAAHGAVPGLTVIGLTDTLDPGFVAEAMEHGVHACIRNGASG